MAIQRFLVYTQTEYSKNLISIKYSDKRVNNHVFLTKVGRKIFPLENEEVDIGLLNKICRKFDYTL